jgi:hypothetical protein
MDLEKVKRIKEINIATIAAWHEVITVCRQMRCAGPNAESTRRFLFCPPILTRFDLT